MLSQQAAWSKFCLLRFALFVFVGCDLVSVLGCHWALQDGLGKKIFWLGTQTKGVLGIAKNAVLKDLKKQHK